MKKNLLFMLTVILFLSGCASLSKTDLPQPAELIKFDPQKIDISYDVFLLRIDLDRKYTTETRTVTQTDSQGRSYTTTQTEYVPVPYHYLGVDMGNGIFLDANMNLSLNLLDLVGIGKDQDFMIVKKGGFLSSDTKYSRNSSKIIIDYGGLFSSKTEIEMRGNNAHFKGGILSSDQDINVEKDKITYDPHGLFSGWSKSYITKVGSSASIPGFWKDTSINKNKDGSINLGESLIVRNEGEKILFRYAGFFGKEKVWTLIRSKNKVAYYDEKMNGVVIEFTENKIKIKARSSSYGSFDTEFIVTKK